MTYRRTRADQDRQRARIGVDPNYTLARTKPRIPTDELVDAPYPRVNLAQAIDLALARLVGATNEH